MDDHVQRRIKRIKVGSREFLCRMRHNPTSTRWRRFGLQRMTCSAQSISETVFTSLNKVQYQFANSVRMGEPGRPRRELNHQPRFGVRAAVCTSSDCAATANLIKTFKDFPPLVLWCDLSEQDLSRFLSPAARFQSISWHTSVLSFLGDFFPTQPQLSLNYRLNYSVSVMLAVKVYGIKLGCSAVTQSGLYLSLVRFFYLFDMFFQSTCVMGPQPNTPSWKKEL